MRFKYLLTYFCIFSLFSFTISTLNAQTLDSNFQPVFRNAAASVYAMVNQPDGKSIVVGSFTFADGVPATRVARLNADGTIDPTFNTSVGANAIVRAVALQDDGKVIIGGDFTSYNNTPVRKLARLNPDGSLDSTFEVGGGPDNVINTIALQKMPDGSYKVIAGGTFNKFNGANASKIVRLNSDGNLDNSFGIGDGFNGEVRTLYLQNDGNLLVGGNFTSYKGAIHNRIIRLKVDGSVDETFNVGAGADNGIAAITVQRGGNNEGKILVGGEFVAFNNITTSRIVRLLPNGTVDEDFAMETGGGAAEGYGSVKVSSFAFQEDGKIIAGGAFTKFNGRSARSIVRLHPNGRPDTTFVSDPGANNTVGALLVVPGNKIIAGGSFTSYAGKLTCIAGLNADGSLDSNYKAMLEGIGLVYKVALQDDGKILVSGLFTSASGVQNGRIARLNPDGSVDATFNTGTGANQGIYAIAIQQDGKILAGGEFSHFNGRYQPGLVRLLPDGSIDETFITGNGFNASVQEIVMQGDKILVGGYFSAFNGTQSNRIIRLNNDGSVDQTFTVGTGFQGERSRVQTMYVHDGKVLVGGGFSSYNDRPANNIIRLNGDGTVDETFNPGQGASATVNTIAMQNDKIVAGGHFTSFNGFARNRIVRLNADGSLDNTFNMGTGANNIIHSIVVQRDNKMLVGGELTTYNGASTTYVIRLHETGVRDTDFTIPQGFNGPVTTVAHLTDNSVLVGGNFTEAAGQSRIGLAKFNDVLASSNKIKLTTPISVYPNPVSESFVLDLADLRVKTAIATLYNMAGQQVYYRQLNTSQGTVQQHFDVSHLQKGMYILHIITDKGVAQKKIVVQ